jgi:hypothetical protein
LVPRALGGCLEGWLGVIEKMTMVGVLKFGELLLLLWAESQWLEKKEASMQEAGDNWT